MDNRHNSYLAVFLFFFLIFFYSFTSLLSVSIPDKEGVVNICYLFCLPWNSPPHEWMFISYKKTRTFQTLCFSASLLVRMWACGSRLLPLTWNPRLCHDRGSLSSWFLWGYPVVLLVLQPLMFLPIFWVWVPAQLPSYTFLNFFSSGTRPFFCCSQLGE